MERFGIVVQRFAGSSLALESPQGGFDFWQASNDIAQFLYAESFLPPRELSLSFASMGRAPRPSASATLARAPGDIFRDDVVQRAYGTLVLYLGEWFIPVAHLTVFILEPFGHATGLRFIPRADEITLPAGVVDKPPLILTGTKRFGAYACHGFSLDRMQVR